VNCPSSINRRAHVRNGNVAGMTLVELLVAMVILSLLMTLVSQAVHQVALIARASQSASEDLHSRWASGWSVSAMLANLVAPPQPVLGPPVMRGSPSQMSGYSTLTLDQLGMGIAPFELTLATDDESPGIAAKRPSALLYRQPDPKDMLAERSGRHSGEQVARFPEPAEFVYVNGAGKLLSDWPEVAAKNVGSEVLPQTVLIRSRASGRILMSYAFQGETRQPAPPSKPFWELQ
jgi:prepilin-type N-terminal cleavage/methylation domain-containing protein